MEGTQNIGEHKGGVAGRDIREDGGQSGECVMQGSSATWDGAIGEKENGSDRVYLLLNLGRNTFLVRLVLLSVGEARSIEDANLWKRSYILATSKKRQHLPPCRSCS